MSGGEILSLLATAEAWAAGGGGHHAPSIHDIWFPLGNFLIYLFIIIKYALPAVRNFLKSRREEVVASIAQASAKKQAAEALVNEYKAKLAGSDKEIQALQASLRDEGEREKSKLLSDAQTLSVKIKEDANFLADQEVKMARQKIREEMANDAESSARRLIQSHLSSADQNKLVDDFIQSIGQVR